MGKLSELSSDSEASSVGISTDSARSLEVVESKEDILGPLKLVIVCKSANIIRIL